MSTNRPEPMPEKLWLTATMQFAADEGVKAGEGTPPLPRFNMVAYTGGTMRLAEWKYPVVVDLAGMAIPSQNRPIRVGHNTDRLVGHTHAIAQDAGRLVASGVLSIPGPDTERVVAGSRNGFPWQASIGARIEQFEFVNDGQVAAANGREFTGPVVIVRKSTLGEISFVDLGADGNTSASVAASAQESSNMTTSTNATENLAATAAADAVTAVRTATATEAKRIAAIRKIYDGKHPDIEAQAIEEGWDATRAELEYVRVNRPAAPAVSGSQGGLPSADVIEAALCKTLRTPNREKLFPEQTLEAADKRFNGLGLQELVVMAAQANGYTGRVAIHRETLPAIFRAAFGPVQAAFSTLSLPGIFSNVANKELLAGFQEEDQTWREVSTVKTVSDFKQITSYRMLDDMEYEELPPGGEMKHGKLSEESYTRQVRTYAKMFSLTSEDLINDDLSAFEDIRTRRGGGAARKFNNVFWTRFLDNAAFFTAGRGNSITGAGTALDVNGAGLQAGILAFRKLKSPDGKRVGGTPVLLLVPPELQFIAQRLYQSTTVNTGGASANDSVPNDNIHAGKYRPVVCDWLSDAAFTGQSAKAWYLFRAATILASVVELGFAAEQSGADMETLEAGLRKMQKFVVEAADGSQQARDALEKLGLTVADLKALAPDDQFKLIADKLSKIENPTLRAAMAMDIFGKSGTRLLPLMIDGADVIEKLQEKARKLGLTISTEDAAAAEEFGDTLDVLWKVIKRGVFSVGAALVPSLMELANWIIETSKDVSAWIDQNRGLVVSVAKITAIVLGIGAALIALGAAVSVAGFAISGLVTLFYALGTVISVISSVLGAILTPVGLVVAALTVLGYLFATQTDAGKRMTDGLKAGFMGLAETAKTAWGGIVDAIKAGDLGLAAKIALAAVSLEWAKAVLWWTEKWNAFKGIFVDGWHDAVAGLKLMFWDFTAWIARTFSAAIEQLVKATAWIAEKVGLDDLAKNLRENFDFSDQNINRNRDRIKGEILDERKRRQQDSDAARKDSEKGAQDDLEKATRELKDAVEEAARKRAGLGERVPPKAKKGGISSLDEMLDLSKKLDVQGTFNALAVRGLGGETANARTAKAVDEINQNVRELVLEAKLGGPVFK